MSERIATIYDYARLKKSFCCKKMGSCYFCPLGMEKNGGKIICGSLLTDYTDRVNEIILKWCNENPAKTYKDDFLEKFPNATLNDGGYPCACREDVYGIRYGGCKEKRCKDCWNEVYKE